MGKKGFPASLVKEMEHKLQEEYKEKYIIEDQDVNGIYFAILNRKRFKYTVKLMFQFILKCLCIRNMSANRYKPSVNKHFLF